MIKFLLRLYNWLLIKLHLRRIQEDTSSPADHNKSELSSVAEAELAHASIVTRLSDKEVPCPDPIPQKTNVVIGNQSPESEALRFVGSSDPNVKEPVGLIKVGSLYIQYKE